jgi:hypothetical protein
VSVNNLFMDCCGEISYIGVDGSCNSASGASRGRAERSGRLDQLRC